MKKLLIICAILLFAGGAFAQTYPITMVGADTLTNADTLDLTQTVKGSYVTVSFQVVTAKLSGTQAGTAILQASVDGNNFVDLNTDTLTFVNQTTNTKTWIVEGSNFYYYRVRCITTGTSSVKVDGYAFTASQGGSNHSVVSMLASTGATSDTVDNTGTGYVEMQVKGSYTSVSIQAVSDSISGTAAGTLTLQGSNDGTNFVSVDTSYITVIADQSPYTTGNSGDNTLTVTNVATSTKMFIVTGSPYAYYRLSHTGSGTMSSRLRGYLMPNRY